MFEFIEKDGRAGRLPETNSSQPKRGRSYDLKPFFLRCLQVICGGTLIIASLGKLQQPYDFLITVYNYNILGPPTGRYFAMVLPYVELTTGAALVGGVCLSGATIIFAGLNIIFLSANLSVVVRGMVVECDCFGAGNEQVTSITLLRNALLLLAVLIIVLLRRAPLIQKARK